MSWFLVFAYNEYYPSGGINDCVLMTNDYTVALKKAQELEDDPDILEQFDFVEIYDTEKGSMSYEFEREIEPSKYKPHTHFQSDLSLLKTQDLKASNVYFSRPSKKDFKKLKKILHNPWFNRGKY